MTQDQREEARGIVQALAEPYAACELELRTQPFTAVYIDARTATARLNRVLPGGWSFRLVGDARTDEKGNITRDGVLVLHYPWGDREYYSTGTETPDQGRGEPKAEKGTDSDCFKRCCFRAGIGAYIYELPKEIRGNALEKAAVEAAARMAGYEGEIRPEHYGPMVKRRVLDGDDFRAPEVPAKASAARDPQPAAPAPAAPANGKGVAENDREKIGRLAHFVWGEAWKAEIKEFAAARKIPYDAAHSAELVKALEERAGEGIGQTAS